MKYFLTLLFISMAFNIDAQELIFNSGFEAGEMPPSCVQTTLLNENFDVPDQQDWAGLWQESGNSIDVAEIINNQGRLVPLASNSPYSLARIYHPLSNAIDVEVTYSFEFENAASQGVGLYVRSNGGHLVNTNPQGQGYVIFIERFSGTSRFGLWYEHNGIETVLQRVSQNPDSTSYNFIDNTRYNVRFHVFQIDANNTQLRARIWLSGDIEPNYWDVSIIDNYAPLQGTAGAVAVDSYNSQSTGMITDGIKIDDIVIKNLCNPM